MYLHVQNNNLSSKNSKVIAWTDRRDWNITYPHTRMLICIERTINCFFMLPMLPFVRGDILTFSKQQEKLPGPLFSSNFFRWTSTSNQICTEWSNLQLHTAVSPFYQARIMLKRHCKTNKRIFFVSLKSFFYYIVTTLHLWLHMQRYVAYDNSNNKLGNILKNTLNKRE